MVDNSSCCLEDTYEQKSSQEISQPTPAIIQESREEPVREIPVKKEQKELVAKLEKVQEESPSPTKKRLSKDFLKGDTIEAMLMARAAAIGMKKRQRIE